MPKYKLVHHQVIESALKNFNADFFCDNRIIFGGGTRIALELDEYRESIDIDFLCPDRPSYRAVREQATNIHLNELVLKEFEYERAIRSDRDAVRTIIRHQGVAIKLEFVSFDSYDLTFNFDSKKFPVPYLSQESCYYSKLLANSDRKLTAPHKDIFDILAMYKAWGSIPETSIRLAENHYGERVVVPSLMTALQDIVRDNGKYFKSASSVRMKSNWAQELIKTYAPKLLAEAKIYVNRLTTDVNTTTRSGE